MVNVRPQREVRFNVLLTEDREQPIEHWTQQLPRLLEPQGVQAYVARSGREALDLAGRLKIHAAVIDLLTPASPGQGGLSPSGGLWLMELLRRLPQQPPIVLVNSSVYGQRQAQRLLNEALRLGAFSVVNRPVELEALLQVIRRVVDRRYAGTWPTEREADRRPEGDEGGGPSQASDHDTNPESGPPSGGKNVW